MDRAGGDRVGVVYGKPVTVIQAQKIMRKFELAEELDLRFLLAGLAIRRDNSAKENFLWNTFVLRHESQKLGIDPTEDEIVAAMRAMPVLQTRGVYDSRIYASVLDNIGRLGMSADDLTELIGDDLRVKRIRQILGATAPPSLAELREEFAMRYQKIDSSVIRLKIDDFLAAVKVSDEDLKKLYDERKIGLKTDELRKVKVAAFVLPATDKSLQGSARAEALQKLEKAAENFSIAMTDKGAKFDEVAAKAGVKVQETPDFSEAKPPAEFESAPEVVDAIFKKLSKAQPNSDALNTNSGYYVIQLEGITPGRQLTFEEAKGRLTDELKHERAQEAMSLKAAEIRNKIASETKAGKSFADAAQAAGVKPETFPAFNAEDGSKYADLPDAAAIMGNAGTLNVGETSALIPTEKGGVIIHLDRREPIDEAKFKSEKPFVAEAVANRRATELFQEWMKLRRAAAQIQTASRG
jgi:parvulin-like peptidyl-prolyl isomerase